jgi:PAS domain S-box-containing protein
VGEKYHLFGVDRDLTELARMEAALHRTQEQFRSVLESVRDVAYKVHRRRGAFSYISPNVEELLGFTPAELVSMRAKGFIKRIHPDDLGGYRDATRRLLREPGAEETASLVEYRLRRRDGDYVWVSDSRRVIRTEDGTPRAIVGTVRDISRRKKAEQERQRFHEQMQQAQRLESLGVLAGGVAHDFNNLLTGVIGNADLALMSLPEDSEARESLQQIQQSAEEAAELASQMLAYSGKGQFVIEPVHLAGLVREVQPLLQAAVPRRVSLEIECQQDVQTFEGDPDQIKQVVINLVTNAAEAIGEGQGTVSLTVTGLEPAETFFEEASLRGDTCAEVYTCLEVADDGRGMDRATRDQIFEPFFTTKFTGRGLGLPAVLGIARAHGGSIRVQSEPGAGTRVQVLFPAMAAPETATRPPPSPGTVGDSSADRKRPTALVVGRNPAVGAIASRTLENAGFRVLRRDAEDEARRLLEAGEQQIDIILADFSGDGAAPGAALEKLRKGVGDVPLIVSSDSGADQPIQKLVETGEAYILQKPYSPGRLKAAVREVLAGPG